MKEGARVRIKGQRENGVIAALISDVALVEFEDRKQKVHIDALVEVIPHVTSKEIIETHEEMLTDEYIENYFDYKPKPIEVERFKSMLTVHLFDLLDVLFKGQL